MMLSILMDLRHGWRVPTAVIALMFALANVSTAQAQLENFRDPLENSLAPNKFEKANFSAELSPKTAKAGDEVTLTVTANLPPKSYIYATTGGFEMRTRIEPKELNGLEPVDDQFHADREPETKFDPILEQEVSKFHGKVSWTRKYRVKEGSESEKVSIRLELTGQYCFEGPSGQCIPIFPPAKLVAALGASSAAEKAVEGQAEKAPDAPTVRFSYSERPKTGRINPAEFHYQLGPSEGSGGKRVLLLITMKLDEEWHTFPTNFEGEGGQPTTITLTHLQGLAPLDADFQANREPELKVEDDLRLQIYHNEVTWVKEFEILPGTASNAYGVEGTIKYQVCKESCVPKSTKFSVGVTSDAVEPPSHVEAVKELTVVESRVERPQDKGLIVFILTAVVAGFFALLTPCVFPMVPITVSFFLKQNESRGKRPILLAIVFSVAIVLSFVVIGVGIAAIFGATKPNELANNWVLNLFLAGVFFAFALNMLGLFEIQMPSWLLSMTATGEQAGGYVGVIFMALTFVLTSFSCTFAFVGSLLAAAAKGEYYWPILGMLAFGTMFAAPFFLLALMPGALKSLPKSGGWLNVVKVVMGFVEVGVAVKYASVVDQQWNSVPWLFDYTNVMTLWAALSICTGLYLLGQFRMTHDTQVQGLSPIRVLIAVGFLVLGGLFGVGLAQPDREAWLVDQLISFAPARLNNEEVLFDFDEAVQRGSMDMKPLFVDFTGVFCVNCRLMEKRMAKPAVHHRLKQFVQAQLYTDKIPKEPDEAKAKRLLERNLTLQSDWFGDVTLPSYAVVTPDGKTILSTFHGLEKREGDFARFLDEGAQKWEMKKSSRALSSRQETSH